MPKTGFREFCRMAILIRPLRQKSFVEPVQISEEQNLPVVKFVPASSMKISKI